jgi:hypothetical protein
MNPIILPELSVATVRPARKSKGAAIRTPKFCPFCNAPVEGRGKYCDDRHRRLYFLTRKVKEILARIEKDLTETFVR